MRRYSRPCVVSGERLQLDGAKNRCRYRVQVPMSGLLEPVASVGECARDRARRSHNHFSTGQATRYST